MKEKPTGEYLLALTWGNKTPDLLFKRKDSDIYYDAAGEEVPAEAIDSWQDITDIIKSFYHE